MPVGDGARTRRFEAVALPHVSAAYNLARWICRNEADAADVVQEAVMRALQYFDSYHGGDARAWLLQIVRNSAHSWIGRNRPVGRVSLVESELDTTPDSADPMNEVAAPSLNYRWNSAKYSFCVNLRICRIGRSPTSSTAPSGRSCHDSPERAINLPRSCVADSEHRHDP
jgi:RNA polymerase sigma factor (sigma-70 family)